MTARSTAAALSAAWPGAVAAQAQEVTLHMGHDNQADRPGQVAGEEFARLVSEAAGGAVEVIVYAAEQLAALRAGAEGVQLGTIGLYYVDSGTLGNWHPEYAFVSPPFLFDDFDHAVRSNRRSPPPWRVPAGSPRIR